MACTVLEKVKGTPSGKWKMSPFNGDWPCSLLASQDPVAIDAVGIDFLSAEFPRMADVDYCDMYLVEAALADRRCPLLSMIRKEMAQE